MFKKYNYFVFAAGLFFSAGIYASPAKITVNDGTPIHELVFSGGAYTPSTPIIQVRVTEDNVTTDNPFPDTILGKDGINFNYIYNIATIGQKASVSAFFSQPQTTSSVEVSMTFDSAGALQQTICHNDPAAPFSLATCTVTMLNGVATLNMFLQS